MESIINDSDASSDEEFYDAEEALENNPLSKWSSMECVSPECEMDSTSQPAEPTTDDSIFSRSFIHRTQIEHSRKNIASIIACGSIDRSDPNSPLASPGQANTCSTNFLIIVLHGGNILESGAETITSKKSDFTTFRGAFESIVRQHYIHAIGKFAFRLVSIPAICADALAVLSSLSPYSFQSSPSAVDGVRYSYDSVPITTLPLFATSSQDYQEIISKMITSANLVYQDFLKSDEGNGFTGHVVLIGDSLGSIIGFDALTRNQFTCSHCESENSISELTSAGCSAPGENVDQTQNTSNVNTSNNNDLGNTSNIPSNTSTNNQRAKSASPANLSLRQNPLISISDGSGNEDCDTCDPNVVTRPHSCSSKPNVCSSSLSASIRGHGKVAICKNPFNHHNGHHHCYENDECVNLYLRLLVAPIQRRRSSGSSEPSLGQKFDFEISDFFMFGSPLGLVLTFRKMLIPDDKTFYLPKSSCNQIYNLFHPMDPCVLRIEPLLSARFSHIPPVNVPKYTKSPLGDGESHEIMDCIQQHQNIFITEPANSTEPITSSSTYSHTGNRRRISDLSVSSSVFGDILSSPLVVSVVQKWWGTRRLDYALYCPEGLTNFPPHSLPHLFHASFWESNDVIAFILRQLLGIEIRQNVIGPEKEFPAFPCNPREKWIKKRTSIKLKNINANHRANDVIVKEGSEQIISARFMYGPLDVFTLTGEKVDIHMIKNLNTNEWVFLSTEMTDKTGRITYTIPSEKKLSFGIYPIKVIVRGDQTSIDFFLAVIPPSTECVVFSIDGSFTASVSVTGRDPKVRAGAVDVVRYWQELGYLIIYITGRPDMQQQRVVSWLAEHNFPFGLVSFADRLSTDRLKHKAEYLKHLQTDVEIKIHAAYGSVKDIWVYSTIGLKPEQINIVSKTSKKQQGLANILNEGYAAHLAELNSRVGSRPAQGNARMVLPRGCLGLSSYTSGFRKRRSTKRATSYPLSSTLTSVSSGSAANSGAVTNAPGSAAVSNTPVTADTSTFTNLFTNKFNKTK